MQFRSCELDNDDDCDTHNSDTLRWIAIEEWIFANEYFLDKTHYRWYENNWINTPAIALADENTTLSTLPFSNQLRLRMLLQNGDPELPAGVLSVNLQYAQWLSCDTLTTWTNVWALWWGEDWLHFDNLWLSDGVVLSNSLLFWWGHTLQSYNESLPTVLNPNPIPVGEWGEWDFSLIKNTWAAADQYCFRAVTEANDEIEYSEYARIDTSDSVKPIITSYTPGSGSLLPIGNFEIDYQFNDADSGIDISKYTLSLQKWDGIMYWSDISVLYESLDIITQTGASFDITWLDYGRYQVGFEVYDNAGNSTFILHELYVDEIEFIISTPEVDIWDISFWTTTYTSMDTLFVTVKTVWAAFRINMIQQTDMDNSWNIIPDWDGFNGFWYEEDPYGSINAFGTWNIVWTEVRNLHPDGDKYTYDYSLKYSVLLDIIENYSAGDYEALLDFDIVLDYD